MPQIEYDKETEILTIRLSNKKSIDSDIQGNVIIDYDKNGKIVKIEIMRINLDEFKKVSNYFDRIFVKKKLAKV